MEENVSKQRPNPPTNNVLPDIITNGSVFFDDDKFNYKQNNTINSPLKARLHGISPRVSEPGSAGSYHDFTQNSILPSRKKSERSPMRARSSSLEPSSLDEARMSLHKFHSRNEEFRNVLRSMMKIGRGTSIWEAELAIMEASCEILKSDRSDIFLLDKNTNCLRSSTRVGRRKSAKANKTIDQVEIPVDSTSLIAHVFNSGEVVCVPSLGEGESHDADYDMDFLNSEAENVKGFIASPIFSGADETSSGVIFVYCKSDPGDVYDEDDVISIEQISDFASNAIRTWETFSRMKNAKDRMEMLIGMIKHISNEMDSHKMIDKMFQMSRSILNADGITLFEIIFPKDETMGEVKLKISRSTRGDALGMTFGISQGIAGYVATTGQLVNLKDPYSDPRFNSQADREKGFKTKSLLCAPVIQQGVVVAVIQAINKKGGLTFSEDDEHMLQYLAEASGISLAQAALLKQVMTDRRQAQVDKIFIELLSKRCTTHSFVTNVMKAAHVLFDMERFSLYLVDHHHQEIWVTVEEENIICVPIGVGIAGKVAETGEMVNVADAYDHPHFQKEIDLSTGFRTKSVLCYPVESLDETGDRSIIGVVQAINRVSPKGTITTFNEEDTKIMQLFCSELSVVMRQMMMEAQFTKIAVDRRSAMNRKSSTAVPVFALASEYRKGMDAEAKYNKFVGGDNMGWVVPEKATSSLQRRSSCAKMISTHSWDLDINAMSLSEMHTTFELCLEQFNLLETHKISSQTVQAFIESVSDAYESVPYHNFYHGFHVFHSVHCILKDKTIGYISSHHVLSLLVSAACHDIGHPGNNNAFEINARTDLAITYSDDSVLERYHCSKTFELLRDSESNLLSGLSLPEFKECRRIIILSILATDMTNHSELQRSLSLLSHDSFEKLNKNSSADIYNTFFGAVLHTADLAGQAVPLKLALVWGERVIAEFSMQSAKETALGLPTAPFMANLNEPGNAANVQSGYITFILKPWWNTFKQFFPKNGSLKQAVINIEECHKFYIKEIEKSKEQEREKIKERRMPEEGEGGGEGGGGGRQRMSEKVNKVTV